MPHKPLTPCRYPGCPKLVPGRYCQEHRKLIDKQYEQYDRDPVEKKRYGRAWKRIRDRYISQHLLCEECLKRGVYTPATEVHHRLPLSRSGTHADSNLEALCASCHSKITAEMGDRWHKK